jgi:hypothetical protein
MGGVKSLFGPRTHVLVHHITCEHEPQGSGVVGIQLAHEHEDKDGKLYEHGSIVLGIGETLQLVQRLTCVCDVAMSVQEEKPDADRELARILAEAESEPSA